MSRVDRVAAWALLVVLVVFPHWLGGALVESVVVVSGLCWALGAFLAWRLRPERATPPSLPVRLTWGVLVAAVVWTVVQALPWPCGLADALEPELQGLLRDTAALTGHPARCGVSWDPGRTRLEALQWMARLAVFVGAWRLAQAGWRRRVVAAVALGALSVSLSGLGHVLAGLDSVYGLYRPRDTAPPVLSPLLNANHYAAASSLGAWLAFLFALDARTQARRWTWGIVAALAGAMVFMSRSRWGAAVFLLGAALLFVAVRGIRSRARWPAVFFVAFGAAAVWGLGTSWQAWKHEVADGDLGKLELFSAAWRHALDHGLVGVGRGAFTVSFLQRVGGRRRYEFAEHWPAQWLADWGLLLGGAMLLVVFLSLGYGLLRRGRSGWYRGAWVAWFGLWLHDMADFSMELVGMGLWGMALWGALLAPRRARGIERNPGASTWPIGLRGRWVWAFAWAAGASSIPLWGGAAWQHDVRRAVETARRQLKKERPDADRALRVVRGALSEHPLEPALVLLGASAHLMQRDGAAGRWITLGLRLAPRWAEGHRLAALWLASQGHPEQALLQLAEAARHDPRALRRGSCPLIRGVSVEDVLRVAPSGEAEVPFVAYLVKCWPGTSEQSERLDAWLRERDPSLPDPWLREAQRLWHRGEHRRAWRALEETLRRDPGHDRALRLAVAWAREPGRVEQVDRWLLRAERFGMDDMASLLRLRARVAVLRGRGEDMRDLVARLRGLAGGDASAQAAVWRLTAQLEQALKEEGRALDAWVHAAELSGAPEDWRHVLALAERLGVHSAGERARRHLRRK